MEAKASSLKNQIQHPFIPLCKVIMNVDRKHTSTFLVEKENLKIKVFYAGEGVKRKEPSCTAGRNVNSYCHYTEQ